MSAEPASKSKSSTPIPTTENNDEPMPDAPAKVSTLTREQWDAIDDMIRNIYAFRLEDGHDPTKLFHRKVNKRFIPDYYDVISEPMALSTIRQTVTAKNYKDFPELVRDLALIPHNAQVYNVADSQAYQDSLVVKELFETELKKIVAAGLLSEEAAKLPYIGEIPPPDDPAANNAADGEADDDDDDEDDDDDDSDDERPKKKKRGRPSIKREGSGRDDTDKKGNDSEMRKRRGRPPKVHTPMEARIYAIMKGVRKFKNSDHQLKINHFQRLPDKAVMPEYYAEIKNPIAMDLINKKLKRKKYTSVEQFMMDMELMYENAKLYNQDDSVIYQDAVHLQQETREMAAVETKRPDSDFVSDEGRMPMPDGILHGGELWKVGDWVHIQNPNDLTKPIPTQIYRTWQDTSGGKWVNACWYYRPEQTVHRFDKHFFEHEVVKTGQYRDHRVEEIIDRCFVMFVTRFNKGRPRGFPPEKEVYVCEARYNEEKHKINKIKTWASCVPDEVREKDYEMDLFDAPRKMRKVPSPIAYLLRDDQKETDDLPKLQWGAENAPPKIGGVHRRPRDPKDSPPPEPTPSPPPQPPPSLARRPSNVASTSRSHIGGQPPHHHTLQPNRSAMASHGGTPMSAQQASQHHPHLAPLTPGSGYNPAPAQPAPRPKQPNQYTKHLQQYTSHNSAQTPHARLAPQPNQHSSSRHHNQTYASPIPMQPHVSGPEQQAPEVFVLPDQANASIPKDIRDQFQQDHAGRILFFSTPPRVEPENKLTRLGQQLGHTSRYIAWRERKAAEDASKNKRKHDSDTVAISNGINSDLAAEPPRKKSLTDADAAIIAAAAAAPAEPPTPTPNTITEAEIRHFLSSQVASPAQRDFIAQMTDFLIQDYKNLYGENRWRQGARIEMSKVLEGWQRAEERRDRERERDEALEAKREAERVRLRTSGSFWTSKPGYRA